MASSLLQATENLKKVQLDEETRLVIYNAAKDLMIEVESSHDFQHRVGFGIGFDLNLFAMLVDQPGRHWALKELSFHTGTEMELLARLLRGMSAYKLIGEDDQGAFYASKCTHELLVPGCRARVKFQNLFATTLVSSLPGFLKDKGYQSITDSKDTALHKAFNTDLDALEYISSQPELLQASQVLFKEQSAARKQWPQDDRVPMHDFEATTGDLSADRVICVDVGGGLGHQLIKIRNARSGVKGRFVLEDLPSVIELAKSKSPLAEHGIEAVVQDIFKAQAVVGAKVYYMRAILHNYGDEICKAILSRLREAMANDSVLWIDGLVLAEHQPDYKSIDYDLLMLSGQSGMERSMSQWSRLLGIAGFRIRDVWRYDSNDAIVVAVI